MARLKDKYLNEVVPGLQEKFNYKNVMAIPKLDKIVVNIGWVKLCKILKL